MYVSMYVCMYVCMYVYVYIYIDIYIYRERERERERASERETTEMHRFITSVSRCRWPLRVCISRQELTTHSGQVQEPSRQHGDVDRTNLARVTESFGLHLIAGFIRSQHKSAAARAQAVWPEKEGSEESFFAA